MKLIGIILGICLFSYFIYYSFGTLTAPRSVAIRYKQPGYYIKAALKEALQQMDAKADVFQVQEELILAWADYENRGFLMYKIQEPKQSFCMYEKANHIKVLSETWLKQHNIGLDDDIDNEKLGTETHSLTGSEIDKAEIIKVKTFADSKESSEPSVELIKYIKEVLKRKIQFSCKVSM